MMLHCNIGIPMRRVIFNQKGGVGKTSITVNLAAIAASRGHRTLVLDLDPQCNASHYLLSRSGQAPAQDVGDYLESTLGFSLRPGQTDAYVSATPFANLHILPGSEDLSELEVKLEKRYKIFKIRELLDALEDYDRVFIDTAPAFNFFTLSALIAADRCLVPFDCDAFARDAIYRMLEQVNEVRADHNEDLQIEGIVVNNFQKQAKIPTEVVERLEQDDELPVLSTRLNASVKMRESHERRMPLVYLAPRHPLTEAYQALYEEIENGG